MCKTFEMAAVVCGVCGKEFRYEAWLRKHAVQHQAQELPCIQPGCTRRFKSRDALRSHVKTQHQDQYRHRCPVCRKGFQDRQKMQAHHREHGSQVFCQPLFFIFFLTCSWLIGH